jgi:hypothetical protein
MVTKSALIDEEPGKYRFCRWQGNNIVVWFGPAGGETVQRLDRMIPEQPAGTMRSDVHVVLQGSGLPTSEARAGFVGMMKRMEGQLACVGVVIEGGGFWASAMRSAVTGLNILAPRPITMRVLGSIDDLVGWLPAEHERRTGVALDGDMLRQAVQEARDFIRTASAAASIR